MAAPNIAPNPHQVSQQQFAALPAQQQPNATIRDRMQQLLHPLTLRPLLPFQRANQLRNSGATVQNNEEFAKIWAIIQNMQQRQSESSHLLACNFHPFPPSCIACLYSMHTPPSTCHLGFLAAV
uniref:ATP-dependent DNA helicase II subunit 2 (EC) n=1 Tax=Ganoderma boninense TaxID=34458 RepID=A0A5K1K133_9APHY|nr:ATP-dependent DNA helicase II subunit 2 (EC [Ganoderma boninense]